MPQVLHLPSKAEIEAATDAMRRVHELYYARPLKSGYLETMFWAGFFAAHLKQSPAPSNGEGKTP